MVKDFDPMGITQVGQSRKGTDVIRWCKRCRKVG